MDKFFLYIKNCFFDNIFINFLSKFTICFFNKNLLKYWWVFESLKIYWWSIWGLTGPSAAFLTSSLRMPHSNRFTSFLILKLVHKVIPEKSRSHCTCVTRRAILLELKFGLYWSWCHSVDSWLEIFKKNPIVYLIQNLKFNKVVSISHFFF